MVLGPGLQLQCFPLVSLSIKPLDSHAAALLPLVCATVVYNHLFCVCFFLVLVELLSWLC